MSHGGGYNNIAQAESVTHPFLHAQVFGGVIVRPLTRKWGVGHIVSKTKLKSNHKNERASIPLEGSLDVVSAISAKEPNGKSAPKRRSPGGLRQPYLTEGQEANNSFGKCPQLRGSRADIRPHLASALKKKQTINACFCYLVVKATQVRGAQMIHTSI